MSRGYDEKYNSKRRPQVRLESVMPTELNPMANQIPNDYDPMGLAELNHNARLFMNGLHIR